SCGFAMTLLAARSVVRCLRRARGNHLVASPIGHGPHPAGPRGVPILLLCRCESTRCAVAKAIQESGAAMLRARHRWNSPQHAAPAQGAWLRRLESPLPQSFLFLAATPSEIAPE